MCRNRVRAWVRPVRSRAASRWHGAVTSSARTRRPGWITFLASCGQSPAPVATATGIVRLACPAVATAFGGLRAVGAGRHYGS